MFESLKDTMLASGLEIVNSIPADESQTALHLYEHLLDLKVALDIAEWKVRYHRCEGKIRLARLLEEVGERAQYRGEIPIIHIECHGSRNGLHLANGDFVEWKDIRDILFKINFATRNRLLVICGSCWGIYGMKAITIKLGYGTPFRMLAGPMREVSSGALESCFNAFYSRLLKVGQLHESIEAAKEIEQHFRLFSATDAFLHAWRAYYEQVAPKTPTQKREKVEQLVTRFKSEHSLSSVKGLHKVARKAVTMLPNDAVFEDYKCRFFMLDAFPELADDLQELTFTAVLAAIKSRLGLPLND